MIVGLKEKKIDEESKQGVDEEQKAEETDAGKDEAEDLTIPGTVSKECADLIKLLTEVTGQKRGKRLSIKQIKQHPFFKSVDWDNLESVEMPTV